MSLAIASTVSKKSATGSRDLRSGLGLSWGRVGAELGLAAAVFSGDGGDLRSCQCSFFRGDRGTMKNLLYSLSAVAVAAAGVVSGFAESPVASGHPDVAAWPALFKADLSDASFKDGVWTVADGVMTASGAASTTARAMAASVPGRGRRCRRFRAGPSGCGRRPLLSRRGTGWRSRRRTGGSRGCCGS